MEENNRKTAQEKAARFHFASTHPPGQDSLVQRKPPRSQVSLARKRRVGGTTIPPVWPPGHCPKLQFYHHPLSPPPPQITKETRIVETAGNTWEERDEGWGLVTLQEPLSPRWCSLHRTPIALSPGNLNSLSRHRTPSAFTAEDSSGFSHCRHKLLHLQQILSPRKSIASRAQWNSYKSPH